MPFGIAQSTYSGFVIPLARLGGHISEEVVTCRLVVEQRAEPVKFLTLAGWTGMVETELFAQTYRNYGQATVR